MAEIVWTEPSLHDLEEISDYIAFDNPEAASRFVDNFFSSVSRLFAHPLSGKPVRELPDTPYREIVVVPCRVFYRPEKGRVYILHVIRGERLFNSFLLDERKRQKE